MSLALLTNCNNDLDKSTTGTLNTETNNNKTINKSQLTSFGKKYSEAWCSQKPASVAAFFSTSGTLKVNADSPAVGREAITKVAEGFMTAFPDMIVAMDSLITNPNGTAFHWTLTGTNAGTGSTGIELRLTNLKFGSLAKID